MVYLYSIHIQGNGGEELELWGGRWVAPSFYTTIPLIWPFKNSDIIFVWSSPKSIWPPKVVGPKKGGPRDLRKRYSKKELHRVHTIRTPSIGSVSTCGGEHRAFPLYIHWTLILQFPYKQLLDMSVIKILCTGYVLIATFIWFCLVLLKEVNGLSLHKGKHHSSFIRKKHLNKHNSTWHSCLPSTYLPDEKI